MKPNQPTDLKITVSANIAAALLEGMTIKEAERFLGECLAQEFTKVFNADLEIELKKRMEETGANSLSLTTKCLESLTAEEAAAATADGPPVGILGAFNSGGKP